MRAQLREENNKYSQVTFSMIPRDQWGEGREPNLFAVWRSFGFLVQCYAEDAFMVRLTVCRTCADRHGEFKAGITWDELQWIKDKVGYADHDAVEIYPRLKDIVNVGNLRHLWVYKTGEVPFRWKAK